MSSNAASLFLQFLTIFSKGLCFLASSKCYLLLQYADSEDEHDGMMDTDEEVTNGRVTLFNGNGPPYFHGYLYMKGAFLLSFSFTVQN